MEQDHEHEVEHQKSHIDSSNLLVENVVVSKILNLILRRKTFFLHEVSTNKK